MNFQLTNIEVKVIIRACVNVRVFVFILLNVNTTLLVYWLHSPCSNSVYLCIYLNIHELCAYMSSSS